MSSDGLFRRGAGPNGGAPALVTDVQSPASGSWWNRPVSGAAIFCLVLTAILSAGAIWMFSSVTEQAIQRNTVLKSRGVETVGAVVGFYSTTSGGRHSTTTQHVRYTYDVPDGTSSTRYQTSSSFADNQYAQLANDRTLPVIYDPQNPGTAVANWNDWVHHWTVDQSIQRGALSIGLILLPIWATVGVVYLRISLRRRYVSP